MDLNCWLGCNLQSNKQSKSPTAKAKLGQTVPLLTLCMLNINKCHKILFFFHPWGLIGISCSWALLTFNTLGTSWWYIFWRVGLEAKGVLHFIQMSSVVKNCTKFQMILSEKNKIKYKTTTNWLSFWICQDHSSANFTCSMP